LGGASARRTKELDMHVLRLRSGVLLFAAVLALGPGGAWAAEPEPMLSAEQRALAERKEAEQLQALTRAARQAVRERRLKDAGEAYVRLWEAYPQDGINSAGRAVLLSFELPQLTASFPEIRQAMVALRERRREAAQPRALLGRPEAERQRVIRDWFDINMALSDFSELVEWTRATMAEPAGRRMAEPQLILLEPVLRAARAWTELAWLYDTPREFVEQQLAFRARMRDDKARFASPSFRLLSMPLNSVERRMELERLALIYVAFRGADQPEAAQEAWAAIRRGEDTGAMRLAIVTLLLEAGLAEKEDARLLDEAQAEGLDVGEFRTQLADALREKNQSAPGSVRPSETP
jgi:hypothetical protein